MAQLDLYVDTFGQSLVTGPNNPAPFQLPNFKQGDTVNFRVFLLMRNVNYPNSVVGFPAFSIVPVGPLTLKMAIGDKAGTGTGNLVASQFTWAKSADGTNFTGALALNTTEMNTAIAAAASVQKWFEIEFLQAGLSTTCFQRQITIDADVIKESGVVPVPGQTNATTDYVNATFLKKDGTGDSADVKVWASRDGTKKVLQYVDDDGEMKFDKI
jgi:hypothetical protein